MSFDLREPITTQALRVAEHYDRRSFLARVTALSLALTAGFATARSAVAAAAPSRSAFASHCSGGFHGGTACSGQSCPVASGGCWYSCCTNLCGGSVATQFCDCCTTGPSDCAHGYCNTSGSFPCFDCKLQSCSIILC